MNVVHLPKQEETWIWSATHS